MNIYFLPWLTFFPYMIKVWYGYFVTESSMGLGWKSVLYNILVSHIALNWNNQWIVRLLELQITSPAVNKNQIRWQQTFVLSILPALKQIPLHNKLNSTMTIMQFISNYATGAMPVTRRSYSQQNKPAQYESSYSHIQPFLQQVWNHQKQQQFSKQYPPCPTSPPPESSLNLSLKFCFCSTTKI